MTSADTIGLAILGDSMALGRDDPHPSGKGWFGWGPRLAMHLGIHLDRVANTAAEGALVHDMADVQLPEMAGLEPDVVAFSCGMNDVIGGSDTASVEAGLDKVLTWAEGTGAVVVTTALLPNWDKIRISRVRRKRLESEVTDFNGLLEALTNKHGAELLRPWTLPGVEDPTMWSDDGIHLSSSGHSSIAEGFAQLAHARMP